MTQMLKTAKLQTRYDRTATVCRQNAKNDAKCPATVQRCLPWYTSDKHTPTQCLQSNTDTTINQNNDNV